MKQFIFLSIAIIIVTVLAINNANCYLPPSSGVVKSAPEPYKQPLIEPLELQQHINAVLRVHGEPEIAEDGKFGIKSRRAWERACALQGGYFMTKEALSCGVQHIEVKHAH